MSGIVATLCFDVLEYLFLLEASLITNQSVRRGTVLSCSQVCRHWRRVALSSKLLWLQLADFDFMPWSWNEEILRRSYPLPIVMGSDFCFQRSVETVGAELEHLQRIKAYNLGFNRDSWAILLEMLQHRAEHLNSLGLTHVSQDPCRSPNPLYHDHAASFILPSTLFSLSVPNLRHLRLRGCFLDVHSPIYTQLTSLTVLDIDTRYRTALTALQWLSLLCRMSQIRVLNLKDAIYAPDSPFRRKREGPSWLSSSSPPPAPFCLTQLERLKLFGPLAELATFLAGIETPPGCAISITCRDCGVGDELDGVLKISFRWLAQSINYNQLPGIQMSASKSDAQSMLPVRFFGNGSLLCMWANPCLLQAVFAAVGNGSPKSENLSSSWIPDFTLRLDAPDACWQAILSPLLAALSDNSFIGKPQEPLASKITSLELLLHSPHPDLVSFLTRTRNVKALVNLPGYFGAWLINEMMLSCLSQSGGVLETEVGANNDVIIPRLEALSFSDDQCLYVHAWSSLKRFLRLRNPAVSISFPYGSLQIQDDVCC